MAQIIHQVRNPNYAKETDQRWIKIYTINADNSLNLSGKLIDPNAVSTNTIVDGAITNSKIDNNSISTDKIINGAITENKISNSSISTNKIQNQSVTINKLALNGDGSVKAAGSVGEKPINGYISIMPHSIGKDDLDESISFDIEDNSISIQKLITSASPEHPEESVIKAAGSNLENLVEDHISIIPASIGEDDLGEEIIENRHIKSKSIHLNKINSFLSGVLINELNPNMMYKASENDQITIWSTSGYPYTPDVSESPHAQQINDDESIDPIPSFNFTVESLNCIYDIVTERVSFNSEIACEIFYQENSSNTENPEDSTEKSISNIKFNFDPITIIIPDSWERIFSTRYVNYQMSPKMIIEESVQAGLLDNLTSIMLKVINSNEDYWFENMIGETKAQNLWEAFCNYAPDSINEDSVFSISTYIENFREIFEIDGILEKENFLDKYGENSKSFIEWDSKQKLTRQIITEEDYDKIGIWVQI